MSESRIDLHAHTNHSDGTCTPTELVTLAADIGLRGLAVTDHDTLSAIPEARVAGARVGVEIYTGCEVTTQLPTGVVHVLVYGVSLDDETFDAFLESIRTARHNRNLAMLEKLETLGISLTLDEVGSFAHGRIVARPHFANALVARGIVANMREAFDRFLRDDGPAYVKVRAPAPVAAIRAAKAAGGASVIAHPRQMKLGSMATYRKTFEQWKGEGLTGIEVHHPSHDTNHRQQFAQMAKDLDLVASSGSDFHGSNKPYIKLGEGDGTIEVKHETWQQLRARMS